MNVGFIQLSISGVCVCVYVCAIFSPVRQRSYTFHTSLHYNQFGGRLNISFEASLCQVSELKCTYNFYIFQQNLSLNKKAIIIDQFDLSKPQLYLLQ